MIEDKTCTYVIFETVKEKNKKKYEKWLLEINSEVANAKGFISVEINHPKSNSSEYATVIRFENYKYLKNWQKSEKSHKLIKKGKKFIDKTKVEYFNGLGIFFHKDMVRKPKYWKQVILSIITVYPLIISVNFILSFIPYIQDLQINLFIFISTIFVSMLIVYPVMPISTKILKRWLES